MTKSLSRTGCLLAFFACTFFLQAKLPVFPSYESVLEIFFSAYQVDETADAILLNFEKTPEGWYVTALSASDYKTIVSRELFWSEKEKKFVLQTFPAKTSADHYSESEAYQRLIQSVCEVKLFNVIPYYGYAGWEDDVIAICEGEKNLPDSIYYALGRAYSSYGSNLLENYSYYPNEKLRFKLADTRNALNAEQLAKYRHYKNKAIESFRKAEQLNPGYTTIVGKIGIKAANEVMDAYLTIRMFQNDEEARRDLPEHLYNDFYVSFAKNLLNSCEKNAILFVNGDNDTYPLLYIQEKLNFRTDVLVVNLSLLQLPRYIDMLRDSFLSSGPLPFSFSKEQIHDPKSEVVYMKTSDSTSMPLSTVISDLKNEKYVIDYGGTKCLYLPASHLTFAYGSSTMNLNINAQYLLRNHIMVLDHLNTNNFNRPVYFAVTSNAGEFFMPAKNQYLEGLASRILPQQYLMQDDYNRVDTKKHYQRLMNDFTYGGNNSDPDNFNFISNYRIQFEKLGRALLRNSASDSAMAVLDRSLKVFPVTKGQADESLCSYVDLYFQLGKKDIAEGIALSLIEEFYNPRNRWKDNGCVKADRQDTFMRAMDYLLGLAEPYNSEKIMKAIAKE